MHIILVLIFKGLNAIDGIFRGKNKATNIAKFDLVQMVHINQNGK